jgi:hypothetical protein
MGRPGDKARMAKMGTRRAPFTDGGERGGVENEWRLRVWRSPPKYYQRHYDDERHNAGEQIRAGGVGTNLVRMECIRRKLLEKFPHGARSFAAKAGVQSVSQPSTPKVSCR